MIDAEVRLKIGNTIEFSTMTAAAIDGLASHSLRGLITSQEYHDAVESSCSSDGYKELIESCDKMIEDVSQEIELGNSMMRTLLGKSTDADDAKLGDLFASFFGAGGKKDE